MAEPTQRDRAFEIVRKEILPMIFGSDPGVPPVARLREILGMAQNDPPDGQSDMSIKPPEWIALTNLANALDGAASAAKSALSGGTSDPWVGMRPHWPRSWSNEPF